jgi:hypothetical protein
MTVHCICLIIDQVPALKSRAASVLEAATTLYPVILSGECMRMASIDCVR